MSCGPLHIQYSTLNVGLSSGRCWRRHRQTPSFFFLVIETRRRNVGMPEPLLHLGDISIVRQGIRGSRGTQRMHAAAV